MCYGLDEKCPLQVHASAHLVPSCGTVLGGGGTLGARDPAGGGGATRDGSERPIGRACFLPELSACSRSSQ